MLEGMLTLLPETAVGVAIFPGTSPVKFAMKQVWRAVDLPEVHGNCGRRLNSDITFHFHQS